MKRKFNYWALLLLLSLGITVTVQLLFRQYRFSHLSHLNQVGILEFVFSVLFLPACLPAVYFAMNTKFKFAGHFSVYILLTIVCLALSSGLDFKNWWDSEGKNLNLSDPEGRDMTEFGLVLQFIISTVVGMLCLFMGRSLNQRPVS